MASTLESGEDARVRTSFASLALFAATLSIASGCALPRSLVSFLRSPDEPMKAWEVRMDPHVRRDCLVVLLPGLFDLPDQFFEHGFVEDARRASDRCDLLLIDAHVGYYQRGTITERLRGDVLTLAGARGYDELWVVGVSMGALGAVLLAEQNPGTIRGIVMIAPWLGEESVIVAARDAGGLEAWTPPPIDRVTPELPDATVGALAWLREHPANAAERPPLYLAVGEEDRWLHHAALITDVVPEAHRTTLPGNHDWETWRRLWQQILTSPPWDPRP